MFVCEPYPNITQSAFNKFLYETKCIETCRNYKQMYLDFTWSNVRIWFANNYLLKL
jgi:hypothetical protein